MLLLNRSFSLKVSVLFTFILSLLIRLFTLVQSETPKIKLGLLELEDKNYQRYLRGLSWILGLGVFYPPTL